MPSRGSLCRRVGCSFVAGQGSGRLLYCLARIWLVCWALLGPPVPQNCTLGSPAPTQPLAGQATGSLAAHPAPVAPRSVALWAALLGDPVPHRRALVRAGPAAGCPTSGSSTGPRQRDGTRQRGAVLDSQPALGLVSPASTAAPTSRGRRGEGLPFFGSILAFHRIPAWSGLAGPSGGPPAQPPAQAGSPRAGGTAPRPGGLEYLQRRRLHSLPGQPGPGLRHS